MLMTTILFSLFVYLLVIDHDGNNVDCGGRLRSQSSSLSLALTMTIVDDNTSKSLSMNHRSYLAFVYDNFQCWSSPNMYMDRFDYDHDDLMTILMESTSSLDHTFWLKIDLIMIVSSLVQSF